ncbi:MAG: DUF4296 domain-containing protein [Bacteroidetes bacterium]|nr:DUF4296 domain-containing protein [Bacteroidota bacterium]
MNRLILFAFIWMMGCRSEMPTIPATVIPMDQMVQIMSDIHIVDAVAAEKAQGGMNEENLTKQYMVQIFKNRGVTAEKFLSSFRFYENHPALFDKIYGEALEEMSRREAKLSKE